MKTIYVLGSGCAKCQKTAEMIASEIKNLGVEAVVEKDTSMDSLLKYQVMSTPAVVIDGKLVHSGGLPRREQILDWLKA
ncbi:thioredoxin family protein [bacterium (Candidatus Blackallbacteria) CG17_big_fil_post_rev_8_21_14_2_50_48_46]|uniref:Thioredoxin family protein n=1 Tax=bacterium (Candidatus Blackallbacteria) CG17_big_fil_post_rev_8_21_14_2_50_48_46 TaxID=2014261 RepID=A0A2M7G0P1_9BACT|nr:MAG: thioredoxin family protein [bacterium (Candidatus Blackallbacteria) CG18_big_fil_WC_8_21_14_2_50_49_26]PIW15252.1 MAG: thioredoxin family protein [bacterium (Candidatus Blackallbacteria) CG17_big_fil_post_rev_8_21_14_2_50_48_46]PIW45239.1 MAG: thioredoxin family protein [bacterium (Candidatus Blackallbacteria) CG13_big_fil_rev_8_21_14_2_50_49_14]